MRGGEVDFDFKGEKFLFYSIVKRLKGSVVSEMGGMFLCLHKFRNFAFT